MPKERRKYKRFSATAFLNMPVLLTSFPPYFGKPLKGQLIDLSAGGMSLVIEEQIPMGTRLNLRLTFPDQTQIESVITIRRVFPKGKKYLMGIEFDSITTHMQQKIEKMSTDYIDCEGRIQQKQLNVCKSDCAFFTMCSKPEKSDPVFNVDVALELAFRQVTDPTIINK